MLLKVKAHIDRDNLPTIYVNDKADSLAGVASSQCQTLCVRHKVPLYAPTVSNTSDFSKAWIHDRECGSKTDLWANLSPLDTG